MAIIRNTYMPVCPAICSGPLSLRNTTSVSFSMARSSSAFSSLPTLRSMAVTIVLYFHARVSRRLTPPLHFTLPQWEALTS